MVKGVHSLFLSYVRGNILDGDYLTGYFSDKYLWYVVFDRHDNFAVREKSYRSEKQAAIKGI